MQGVVLALDFYTLCEDEAGGVGVRLESQEGAGVSGTASQQGGKGVYALDIFDM